MRLFVSSLSREQREHANTSLWRFSTLKRETSWVAKKKKVAGNCLRGKKNLHACFRRHREATISSAFRERAERRNDTHLLRKRKVGTEREERKRRSFDRNERVSGKEKKLALFVHSSTN